MRVDVTGVFLCLKYELAHMIRVGRGEYGLSGGDTRGSRHGPLSPQNTRWSA